MSLKAKQQPTEIDHVRDTLTDVVRVVGDTRQDVKILGHKVDEIKSELTEVKSELTEVKSELTEVKIEQVETRKDIARLEQLILQLISDTNN